MVDRQNTPFLTGCPTFRKRKVRVAPHFRGYFSGVFCRFQIRQNTPLLKMGYFCTRQNTPKKSGVFLYPTKYPEKKVGYFCTRQNTPLFNLFSKKTKYPQSKNYPKNVDFPQSKLEKPQGGCFVILSYVYTY